MPALEAYEQFSIRLSAVSRLDARTRELVTLRVAQLLGNAYAWRRHVPMGIDATVSIREIASIARWRESDAFSGSERAVLELVDEYLGRRETDEATLLAVRESYGDERLIEILLVLGWFQLVATIMVPLDVAANDPEPADLAVPFERVRLGG